MEDINKARPTSHSYFSQRLKLHYLDWGNESAPHMLLIHGIHDHCHTWDWVAQTMCSAFHVVVPDLRGHGDSDWAMGGAYGHIDDVYDIAQLVHQEELDPVHIIAHSLGGTLACILAGIYPEKIASLTVLEGVGGMPGWYMRGNTTRQTLKYWIDNNRKLAGRSPRKYPSLAEAFQRMQKSNPHLDEQRARHLTIHGGNRNEDGTYTWKFDNYTHSRPPYDIPYEQIEELWREITCPVLLITATEGYPHRIGQNDTAKHFRNVESALIERAGHWVHHDQLDEFLKVTQEFLQRHFGLGVS